MFPFNVNSMITFKLLNKIFFHCMLVFKFYCVLLLMSETFQQVLHVLRFQTMEGQRSLNY